MAPMSVRREDVPPDQTPPAVAEPTSVDHRLALSDLYRREYRNLVHLAAVLLDRWESAEEVVQEAFVRLDRRWDRVEDPDRRVSYLRSIVMNLARSQMRGRLVFRRHAPVLIAEDESPAADADIESSAERDEIITALRGLPTRQQQVLALRYYADLSEAEIADTLGISTGAVKSHAHRAIAAMEQKLEGLR